MVCMIPRNLLCGHFPLNPPRERFYRDFPQTQKTLGPLGPLGGLPIAPLWAAIVPWQAHGPVWGPAAVIYYMVEWFRASARCTPAAISTGDKMSGRVHLARCKICGPTKGNGPAPPRAMGQPRQGQWASPQGPRGPLELPQGFGVASSQGPRSCPRALELPQGCHWGLQGGS